MKKLLTLVLCAVLICAASFSAPRAFAATEDIALEAARDGSAVTVTVKAAAALTLNGLQVVFEYDKDAFELTGAATAVGDATVGAKIVAEAFPAVEVAAGDAILTITLSTKEAFDEKADYSFSVEFEQAYASLTEDLSFAGETVSVVLEGEKDDVMVGDVNGDHVVDAKDVTFLRRYLVGGWNVTIVEANCDINKDGAIDAKDVTFLRRYLVGGWGIVL